MKHPSARVRTRRRAPNITLLVGLGVVVVAGVVGGVVLVARDADEVNAGPRGATGADFHSLVADPTRPGRLFVGGHEAVSASIDGGGTWDRLPALDDADAMGWGFAAGTIYVSGHPGLTRGSADASSFQQANEGLPGTDLHAFGAGRSILYGSAVDGGFVASTDGGATWQVRSNDANQAFFGRIVVDVSDESHLLVADAQVGVAESRDGGRTWAIVDSGLQAATWLSSSTDLTLLVASGPVGVAVSNDAGSTWAPLEVPEGVSLVEVDPMDASRFYAGVHDGAEVRVLVSENRGQTWGSAR